MRRRLLSFLLTLALALTLTSGPHAEGLKAWGYVVWWLPQGWKSAPLSEFERLLLFQFSARPDGSIETPPNWPGEWVELRAQADRAHVPMDLSLTLLDRNDFLSIFRSPEATRKLLDNAVALARQPGISGLHLDVEVFEAVDPRTVQAYQNFVRELSQQIRLSSPQRGLSVFVPLGKFRSLYTAELLAQMDHVVLQGYDVHWEGSPQAGPVAPLDGPYPLTWRGALRQADAWGLDRGRIRLGFPLYGYEWPVRTHGPHARTSHPGRVTSFMPLPPGAVEEIHESVAEQVMRFGAAQDVRSGSGHYEYKDLHGRWHEGWFEDWWSLAGKAQFLQDEQVGGIAFFPLGYDNGQLVQSFFSRRPEAAPPEEPAPSAPLVHNVTASATH